MRRRTAVLTVSAALVAALSGPAGAEAANKCRAQAERGRVLAQSTSALVYSTGSQGLNLTVRACLFRDQKLYVLPGQNGGDTEHLGMFRLNGRYVAWEVVNAEPAASVSRAAVQVADIRTRRRIVNEYAGPDDPTDPQNEVTSEVAALALNSRGAVAWSTRLILRPDSFSIHTAAPGTKMTVLDSGTDVAARSLAVSDDGNRLYWTRADQVKGAAMAVRR